MGVRSFVRRLFAGGSVPAVRNATLFEAGSTDTRRTVGWRAPTASANEAILGSLTTLRDRSRAATRNDGWAKSAIDRLVYNIVGTGLKPLSQAADPQFRAAVQALWLRWTDEADADGLLDYYGLQTQAVRTWLTAGEDFTRLRPRLASDGLSVPFQIQNLEPEFCPSNYTLAAANMRVRAGIEFNGIGKRVAYYFHPSRPELDDYDQSRYVRVPAEAVVHLFNPERPGQLRGVPRLTAGLISLYELDKYEDAQLLRQQLANLFAMFVKRDTAIGDAEALHPLTGEAPTTLNEKPLVAMEPGIVQELEPGEDVTFSEPPESTGFADFSRQVLRKIGASVGVPYELLTGDLQAVNDRSVRVLLSEFRREIQSYQHQVVAYQFCRPIWRAWMDRVFLSGALDIPASYATNPAPWLAVSWVPQGWPYINPAQDVEAEKSAIRSGLKSRSASVSERGDDAEVIDAEQARDNARADELGLRYDSDGRQALNARSGGANNPAEPEPGREPEPEPARTGARE